METYDFVIVGSGLGGLATAIILAKEGKKVCVIEKNNQFGGNLQTFVRDKIIFDTGVHYIGGLDKGSNLYHFFNYLGIAKDLKIKKMDEDAYDIISFGDDSIQYSYAQGYDNFVKRLTEYFPTEKKAIENYVQKIQSVCNSFPMYNIGDTTQAYNFDTLREDAHSYINSITDNEKLKSVLMGSDFLYCGMKGVTPLYVHALSVNSYIQNAWRCLKGGSQISKLLVKQIRLLEGKLYKHTEIVGVDFDRDNNINCVISAKGNRIYGKNFIFNIDVKRVLDIVGKTHFKKSFCNRIQKLEPYVSPFSLYIVLKKKSLPYFNCNYYHHKDSHRVWESVNYEETSWPESFMLSTGIFSENQLWADNLTAMTYMRYEELKPWIDTFNTVALPNQRGETYEQFKKRKKEQFLKTLEERFPDIQKHIEKIYTSTALTYRDYIGINQGSLYGYVHDSKNPLKSFIFPRTNVKNLYLTGQTVNIHGVLGVTIGAFVTCSEILGKEYLFEKLKKSLE